MPEAPSTQVARPSASPRGQALLTLLPGALLVALGIGLFAGVLDAVDEQDDVWLVDQPVLEWLADNRVPWLTSIATGVTNTFGPTILPVLVAVGCGAWWAVSKRWRDPALLVAAMLLAVSVSTAIKALVGRPRPPEVSMSVPGVETSASFPSGHTIGAATLVLVLAYLVARSRRTWRATVVWAVVSVVVIVVVAATRLYLGYHFVTDVLAGACLAIAVLGVVVCVDRWPAQDRPPAAQR
ncbi:undecaprenyl-diphosphatase [Flavimobilis soli]|uniref:Undecaprenyl-diphosphatase n=1 Tax=Flavimobilis soli TaxID=442709 RepID=A0A2A9EAS6_9MICO|nr:phosphatase PAP2 family protein [Flavimobilis soli]PFG36048.1 undecaprenyl-diphosphatase [Flavimobilis soli]